MNINPADLDQSAVKSYVEKSHDLTLVGFLMDIIPNSLIGAFTGDQVVNGKLTGPNILQVLFVAVLFGVSLALVGERGKPVLNLLEALIAPVFKLVHILMRAARSVPSAPSPSPSASTAWSRWSIWPGWWARFI